MKNEELLQSYAKLVWYVAGTFYGVDREDLYLAGWEALLKAHKNYNPNLGAKFSSFAYNAIRGAMYELVNNKMLKVSRDVLKLKKDIEKASDILTQLNGWIPSLKEISQFLGYDIDKIKMALESANPLISLDDEKDSRSLHETIKDQQNYNIDDAILLEESMQVLDPMEKEIITSRYYQDLTQSETAKKLGINQVKVSRYETRSLNKMRDFINL